MTESEIWKDVVGYEGLYEVSDKGNVYSVERKDTIGRKCGGRTLTPRPHPKGYLQVTLYKDGVSKHKMIHRLVADAFIANPKSFLEVNHLDEVKTNNELSNLEWCTSGHNVNHGTRNERSGQAQSKKVRAVNAKTGEVVTFNSTAEAGRKGYNQGSVAQACKGVYKTATGKLIGGDGRTYRGYKWEYEEAEESESK